eukprot:31198-Pelagococcus_subviridis.AAC.74
MESAAEVFHSSSHTRFHSDTIEAVFDTHSHSVASSSQMSFSSPEDSSVHPSRVVHLHAGIRAVNTVISVRNAAGNQAAEDIKKCRICARPFSPTCSASISSNVRASTLRDAAAVEAALSSTGVDAYSSARRTSELSDDAVIPAAVLEGAPQACARGSNAPSLLGKIRK